MIFHLHKKSFQLSYKNKKSILNAPGEECRFENWRESWKRIYKLHPEKALTENVIAVTKSRLTDRVKTLQPRIEKWKKPVGFSKEGDGVVSS